MKPGSNSVEDHPQLSHNRHPVDVALVGAGSLWPKVTSWSLVDPPFFLANLIPQRGSKVAIPFL